MQNWNRLRLQLALAGLLLTSTQVACQRSLDVNIAAGSTAANLVFEVSDSGSTSGIHIMDIRVQRWSIDDGSFSAAGPQQWTQTDVWVAQLKRGVKSEADITTGPWLRYGVATDGLETAIGPMPLLTSGYYAVDVGAFSAGAGILFGQLRFRVLSDESIYQFTDYDGASALSRPAG